MYRANCVTALQDNTTMAAGLHCAMFEPEGVEPTVSLQCNTCKLLLRHVSLCVSWDVCAFALGICKAQAGTKNGNVYCNQCWCTQHATGTKWWSLASDRQATPVSYL